MSGVLKKSTSWREKAPKRKRYWDSCACATIWTSFTEGPTRIELCVAYLSFRQNYCVWHNLILKFQFIFLPIFTRHPFESCFPPDSHLFPLNGVIFCDSFFFPDSIQYCCLRLFCWYHIICVFPYSYLDNFATEFNEARISSVIFNNVLLWESPVTQPPSALERVPVALSAGRLNNKRKKILQQCEA